MVGRPQGGGGGGPSVIASKNKPQPSSTKRAKKSFVTDPAVKIPHDGPLAHLSFQSESRSKDDEEVATNTSTPALVSEGPSRCSPSEKAAIDLLQSIVADLNSAQPSADTAARGQVEAASIKLLTDLQLASDVQNQLASLRSYRSTVLHISSRKNESANDSASGKEVQDAADPSNNANIMSGTYRILVELSLSAHTPIAVARAVRSSLEAIRQSEAITFNVVENLHGEVATSILNCGTIADEGRSSSSMSMMWSDPILTLFQALSYDSQTCAQLVNSSESIGQTLQVLLNESNEIETTIKSTSFSSMADDNPSASIPSSLEITRAVDRGTEIASTLKLVMAQLLLSTNMVADDDIASTLDSLLDTLLLPLLACTSTSTDSLSKVGVALGQVWLYGWCCKANAAGNGSDGDNEEEVAQLAARMLDQLAGSHLSDDAGSNSTPQWMIGLPDLNILAAVRGASATLPDSVLLLSGGIEERPSSSSLLSTPIGCYLLDLCQHATDPAVRLSAIRGLDTVLTRVVSILRDINTADENHDGDRRRCFCKDVAQLVEDALEVALGTWENSSSRQVSCAVPGLFGSLIKVMQASAIESLSIDAVVNRVLKQPSGRKGRYIALEALLKDGSISGTRLLELGGGSDLIASFIDALTFSESNARAIADLMGKMLCRVREEMNEQAGVVDLNTITKKKRRKREKELAREKKGHVQAAEAQSQLLPQWIDLWAGPIASALLSPVVRRRTRVSAFCLPMLEITCGGPTRRTEVSHGFSVILDELNKCNGEDYDCHRILWAKLEAVRQARNLNLTKMSVLTSVLKQAISEAIPRVLLESALTRNDPTIQLAAFSSLDAILPSYFSNSDCGEPLELISQELELWKTALPYASKCSGKEHISQMIKSLEDLLSRASNIQAEQEVEAGGVDVVVSFCGFLIKDLFVKCGSYPGTVADKESFALPLAQCLLSFACDGKVLSQNTSSSAVGSKPKTRTKNKGTTNRRLTPGQIASRGEILRLLATSDVFGAFMSLMHSMWDKTRALAYEFACDLVNQAILSSIALPPSWTSLEGQRSWRARSFHLLSSPRQREADTGARMLGLLYSALPAEQRRQFLDETVSLADDRIGMMGKALGIDTTSGSAIKTQTLPLAYGLLQALRLMLEKNKVLADRDGSAGGVKQVSTSAYEDIVNVAERAIQTSLAIVADIKKDDEDDMDTNVVSEPLASAAEEPKKSATPLNVNTGAIGANAVYSSIKAGDREAEEQRYALQRVIVGSWLLTKEACATLATAIVEYPSSLPPAPLVEGAGSMLISAMVSLKHQGAAFAAHNALQRIALICNSFEQLLALPDRWAKRILHEISSEETVRDSTLRRSTGYALGLLSLMRTQPSLSAASGGLCQDVLAEIVRLSLPSAAVMERSLEKWKASGETVESIFAFPSLSPSGPPSSSSSLFVNNDSYEIRTRVHALNILRLAILDSPLATVVNKFVGDAFISAILGYCDSSWRVRSSATMVFAGAMLRVVDANKNASSLPMNQKDGNKTSGTAITAVELFRCYPPLAHFLQASLKEGIGADTAVETLEEAMCGGGGQEHTSINRDHLHPALFPVLLLLSRLQPVAESLTETSASDLTNPFIEPVLFCLKHRHHKVRVVAARALSVLCSGDGNDSTNLSSRKNLLGRCSDLLARSMDATTSTASTNFNVQHGLLLGVQALLHSSPSSEILLEDKSLFTSIEYLASWCNGSGACPPLCAKTALETWAYAETRKRQINGADDIAERLMQTAYSVVRQMEVLAAEANSGVIGAAQLGMAAGEIACVVSFGIIFSPTQEDSIRAAHIDKLERLLTSECYDARLSSVKAFKKRIWSKVDALLMNTSLERQTRAALVAPVCEMLTRALCSEMERQNKEDILGAHPPTLKRLSRCTLECLAAYRSLSDCPDLPVSGISANDLWKMVVDMRELGRMATDGDEEADAGTSLAGNAVELLALILSSGMLRHNNEHDVGTITKKVKTFVDAVSQSTDPSIYWVVRHSAAVAVGTSGILKENFFAHSDSDKFDLKQMRLDSYLSILAFLQDCDDDVRSAAGKSLSSSLSGPSAPSERETTHHVPLMELEIAYKRVGEGHNDEDLTTRLLNTILNECRGVQNKVELVLSEFSYSEQCQDGSKLLNLSSTRKIFEAEDSNPYSEPLITCQLSASILGQAPRQDANDKVLGVMDSVTSDCNRIIDLIKSRASEKAYYDKDIAHNLTWNSEVFPAFHGLLIGAIVSVYLGCRDPNAIVTNSQELLATLDESGQSSIHPCILEALQVLSKASAGDGCTRDCLFKACFLAPSICLPSSTETS